MKRIKNVLIVTFGIVSAAAAMTLLRVESAAAARTSTGKRACANTYCNPGWNYCATYANAVCTLNAKTGACEGWTVCGKE